jgi:hypothetical protein
MSNKDFLNVKRVDNVNTPSGFLKKVIEDKIVSNNEWVSVPSIPLLNGVAGGPMQLHTAT